jgi:outer membrane protein
MKIKFRTIVIIAFVLNSFCLTAQDTLKLSIDSAIIYALDHNKTLINSKYAIDNSAQKIKEAIALGLPQVSATVDYANYLGAEASIQLSPQAPPVIIDFNPTSNFTASANELLFNGSYYVGVQLAKLGKTFTEQSYQVDEEDVKAQTIQAYYTILVSEQLLKLIKENKTNAEAIYEKTNNLVKAGTVELIEAKKLSIMVATAENAIKTSERQVELGYYLLRLQLGIESDSHIKLTSSLDDLIQKHIIQAEVKDSFNVKKNVGYKLIEIQGILAKKSIDLKKTSYLPSLAAYYSYTDKLKKPLFDMTPKNVIGLTLSVPIFSSGERFSQLNQAKISYKITQNTKDLYAQKLTLQEKQLKYNYTNLYEQYLNQRNSVEVAKEVLEQMNLKYDQGLVSSLELTSANSSYLTAETSYISTLLQLLDAELALRKINNKL